MCFAVRNGMVGVKINYRLAPANPWPSGAKDVAAATSWVHQNIDLFGGDRDEIVAVGYSVGAFHVASLLAHPELQDERFQRRRRRAGVGHLPRERRTPAPPKDAYSAATRSKYEARSAFPGILDIETPLLLGLVGSRSAASRRAGRKAEGDVVPLRHPLPAHRGPERARQPRLACSRRRPRAQASPSRRWSWCGRSRRGDCRKTRATSSFWHPPLACPNLFEISLSFKHAACKSVDWLRACLPRRTCKPGLCQKRLRDQLKPPNGPRDLPS